MGDKFDEMKGRAKEAAGDLADDDELKREGKMDRAGASVKRTADDAKDKVDDAVDAVKDRIDRADDDR